MHKPPIVVSELMTREEIADHLGVSIRSTDVGKPLHKLLIEYGMFSLRIDKKNLWRMRKEDFIIFIDSHRYGTTRRPINSNYEKI